MVRIVQLSDCHLTAEDTRLVNEVYPNLRFRTVLEHALSHHPDGVILTGDLSGDDTIESYTHLMAAMSHHCAHIPWRVIPGNHDNNPHFDAVLKNLILSASSPWHCAGIDILGLDTRHRNGNGCLHTTEMFALHTHMIKRQTPSILALHHPPFALTGWMKAHDCVNESIFAPWLKQQSHIACVLHGHLHAEGEINIEGVPVLGAPATCYQYSQGEEYGYDASKAGYRMLDIDDTLSVLSDVIWINEF